MKLHADWFVILNQLLNHIKRRLERLRELLFWIFFLLFAVILILYFINFDDFRIGSRSLFPSLIFCTILFRLRMAFLSVEIILKRFISFNSTIAVLLLFDHRKGLSWHIDLIIVSINWLLWLIGATFCLWLLPLCFLEYFERESGLRYLITHLRLLLL